MSRSAWQLRATCAVGGGILALAADALGLIPDAPLVLRLLVIFAFGLGGGMIVSLLNDLRLRGRAEREKAGRLPDEPAPPPAWVDPNDYWSETAQRRRDAERAAETTGQSTPRFGPPRVAPGQYDPDFPAAAPDHIEPWKH